MPATPGSNHLRQTEETKKNFDRIELDIADKASMDRLMELVWRIVHICFLINKTQARNQKQSKNAFSKIFQEFYFYKNFKLMY